MDTARSVPLLLGTRRPSRTMGVLAIVVGAAAATAAIYPLRHVAPVVSLGVVYLPAVVVVSMFWGLGFGVAAAVLCAAAFSYFHLPPIGRLTLSDGREWVGLAAFAVVAVTTGFIAELARARADEADQRRREADLAADLARILLGAMQLADALPLAGERLARALGVAHAAIELDGRAREGSPAIELRSGELTLGVLLIPAPLSAADHAWVTQRVVPSLVSILAAALHRDALGAEVVETAALRRSDEMKTAILRSVSHDLRTPVTAILGAAATLDPSHGDPANVAEVRELVLDAGTRLWLLIEKLLDLSMLQSGQTPPKLEAYSLEEVLHEAVAHAGRREVFRLSVDPELPVMQGDPIQLERAFANVLENAARYSQGKPVSVRARVVGPRIRVLVVDQGPGLPAAEHERVFLPFYRGSGAPGDPAHHGSGLGLAIAKGFVEAAEGRISVESVLGQGTTFVIELPVPAPQEPAREAQATGAAAPVPR